MEEKEIAKSPLSVSEKEIKDTRRIIDATESVLSRINPRLASSGGIKTSKGIVSQKTMIYEGYTIRAKTVDNDIKLEIEKDGKIQSSDTSASNLDEALRLGISYIKQKFK